MAFRKVPIEFASIYGNSFPAAADAADELVRTKLEVVVPVGCLVPVLFLGGCALAILFFALGLLKQTDAYKTALACAQENPAVIQAIGSPISQTGIDPGLSARRIRQFCPQVSPK